MDSKKYIGMDVHKESISIAVMNGAGKIVMECVIETKASMILQFFGGMRGDLHVTFEEGTSATWLYVQNRSRSFKWAGKQEKLRPQEGCFFLTSPFIELHRSWRNLECGLHPHTRSLRFQKELFSERHTTECG